MPYRTCTRQHTQHQFDACRQQHTPLLFMTIIAWDIEMKKMIDQKHQIEWLIIFLLPLLTFRQLECCTSMYDFRMRGKFKVWSEYFNHYGIYQTFTRIPLTFMTKRPTLEVRIDWTPCLSIITFFATLPNLIQHSQFINF